MELAIENSIGGVIKMKLFVITDEDNLYFERVGSQIYDTQESIFLDLGDDKVHFLKKDVARII